MAARSGTQLPPGIQAREVPPTLTDVFTSDTRSTASRHVDMGELGPAVTEAQVAQVIAFYVATPADNISGLRSQAHKRFIMGLTEAERTQLASEVTAYVHEHGFLGPPL